MKRLSDIYLDQLNEAEISGRKLYSKLISSSCRNTWSSMSETQRSKLYSRMCGKIKNPSFVFTKDQSRRRQEMKQCLKNVKVSYLQKEFQCIKSLASRCGSDLTCKKLILTAAKNISNRLNKAKQS